MWPRLTLEDIRVVCHYLGKLLLLIALLMAIPLLVAICMLEFQIALNYLVGIGATLLAGYTMCIVKVRPTSLKRKQAIIVTGLAWMVCSLFAAIPLFLSGH